MLSLIVLVLAAQGGSPFLNGDFESGAVVDGSNAPLNDAGVRQLKGWFETQGSRAAGYRAALVPLQPVSGKLALEIKAGAGAAQGFGNVMQVLDPSTLRGKRVRFKGQLRAVGNDSEASLWLRVDRPGGGIGFFDNMSGRGVGTEAWGPAEIIGDIDRDAVAVSLGVMFQGHAEAIYADDLRLEVLGPTPPTAPPEAARPLTGASLQAVAALTQAAAIVRIFHASDEARRAPWLELTTTATRTVEKATTPAALATALNDVLTPVAPTAVVFVTGTVPRARPLPRGPLVQYWKHSGFNPGSANVYASTVEKVPVDKRPAEVPDPAAPSDYVLPGGVTLRLPLAVFADEKGSLPRAPATKAAKALPTTTVPSVSFDDRASRLAAVGWLWAVPAHFYPYFDVVKVDWNAALDEALASAATDTAQSFDFTVGRLGARLQDGHAWGSAGTAMQGAELPLQARWLGDQWVVTQVATDAGVRPGDAVLRIDGTPVAELRARAELIAPASSPQGREVMASMRMLQGSKPSATLELQSLDGGVRTVSVARGGDELPGRASFSEVAPGVLYIDLRAVTQAEWDAHLPKVPTAKGLVFDLRGYPGPAAMVPFAHLTDTPITSAQWRVPLTYRPKLEGATFPLENWTIEPAPPRWTMPVAFLTDAHAISYGETVMGIVEAYHLGSIVGGPTAGTNGNINTTHVGSASLTFTGMKVLKHDGSRHHGIGILPTLPVTPTRAGLAAGRDEVLEAAVKSLGRPATRDGGVGIAK